MKDINHLIKEPSKLGRITTKPTTPQAYNGQTAESQDKQKVKNIQKHRETRHN